MFDRISIKRRLMLITMLITAVALLLTSIAVVAYDVFSHKKTMMETLSVQAEMIGNNSTAALAFRDPMTGQEILSALKADANIMAAALYLEDDTIFALYTRPGAQELSGPPELRSDGVSFRADHADAYHGIILDGKRIGAVYLRADLAEFNAVLKRQAVAVLLIITVSFLVSFPLFTRLQKTITRPITVLVDAARDITRDKDYTVRAAVQHMDEMGFLTECFNEMLDQIQQRDAELERHRRDLEKAVAERTAQLIAAQEELMRKQKLAVLGQLAGSVGHELRNPLGVINNAVYFLKKQLPDMNEAARDIVNIIKSEVDNSLRIVSDMLDFARTKQPQRRMTTVGELIDETMRTGLPAGVKVRTEIPVTLPAVNVDPLQMKQVFQNIISNAVQAMPDGGSLEIAATGDGESGTVRISVKDTGVGIAPENMGKLFQPLFTSKARGIGFGLTIVKNLTEAQGGSVAVESTVGKGTTVTVILPAPQQTGAPA